MIRWSLRKCSALIRWTINQSRRGYGHQSRRVRASCCGLVLQPRHQDLEMNPESIFKFQRLLQSSGAPLLASAPLTEPHWKKHPGEAQHPEADRSNLSVETQISPSIDDNLVDSHRCQSHQHYAHEEYHSVCKLGDEPEVDSQRTSAAQQLARQSAMTAFRTRATPLSLTVCLCDGVSSLTMSRHTNAERAQFQGKGSQSDWTKHAGAITNVVSSQRPPRLRTEKAGPVLPPRLHTSQPQGPQHEHDMWSDCGTHPQPQPVPDPIMHRWVGEKSSRFVHPKILRLPASHFNAIDGAEPER